MSVPGHICNYALSFQIKPRHHNSSVFYNIVIFTSLPYFFQPTTPAFMEKTSYIIINQRHVSHYFMHRNNRLLCVWGISCLFHMSFIVAASITALPGGSMIHCSWLQYTKTANWVTFGLFLGLGSHSVFPDSSSWLVNGMVNVCWFKNVCSRESSKPIRHGQKKWSVYVSRGN